MFADAKFLEDGGISRTCRISDPYDSTPGHWREDAVGIQKKRAVLFEDGDTPRLQDLLEEQVSSTGSMSTLVRSGKERLLRTFRKIRRCIRTSGTYGGKNDRIEKEE